ncbi:xanthine dehydrogenase family protein molybdopterin-binding subunit [Pseudomonas gingeri]|uniref:Xanthine dehydrogenase family protein molybdopterin-binding subunit n=1 Tax=Pseudomonas gingeri TaxID=117681 RepID=A0A7Y7YIW3_9PSED|nr:molybdopterin cofactor-binding domain-containing protein [Pseudomonas gingeri]NWA04674.1 xanthine dehydrogenase family protein molybdopterin-binding subunit [Pseudomonas gingeri]NWA14010.1 xanthine dehydrogenase family protein molybdopterin-binding subunit [Pseudomonas gingeri]NWA59134.1 xanthine dehydrogenase family protein molybdopterin-binding subunit [Pseudomonas gingeri]NWA99443.1 xanthine dehydrogenase family protein molybdopterin-binding subunit [Pseudomonas gingeri]NWB05817.1 xanthi
MSIRLDTTAGDMVSRRGFLKIGAASGGGLLLSLALPGAIGTSLADGNAPFEPNAFIRVDRQGKVTFTIAQVEMGQGTYTSIPVLIAEELAVRLDQVLIEHAPADNKRYANPLLGFQVTGGSTSIRSAWEPLRQAGATARTLLLQAAALQWNVAPSSCVASEGVVRHEASQRSLAYGDLVEKAATLPVPEKVELKSPEHFQLIGLTRKRTDSPAKVNGTALYGIDVRPEGVKVAAVTACPVIGGSLASVDDRAALAVKGVLRVIRIDNAVAVVAEHMGAARKALALLEIRWNDGANGQFSTEKMLQAIEQASRAAGAVVRNVGDVEQALAQAEKKFEVVYQVPFLAHACMEPMNCTVHVRAQGCDLWLGTQVPARAQAVAAQLTGLAESQVQVHNHLLGGGFGRRLDVDFVTQAVAFAKQVEFPLKVIWSREEDTRHSTLRPYHFNHLSAGLDAAGRPTAWTHKVTGSSILARWLPARFTNGIDGDAIRDPSGPYDFPNIGVSYIRHEPPAGITTGFWRGVGHTQNVFMVEGFIDELAASAGQDPVAYRLALLDKHPRARKVLEAVAQHSGWGTPLEKGRGRGVALTFCFGTYAAQVAEVSVDAAGQVRVHKVTCVVDCGRAIVPDSIVAQMQGGAVFGLSAALFGNITFKDGKVEQGNFDTYRVLRMNEMPSIETHLLDSDETPGGIGEVSTVTIAPALVNAVFAATGKRLRQLPVDSARLASA